MPIRSEQDRWAGNTLADFERDLADNLCYERGTTAESASLQDAYWTLAVTIRDRLADRRARTAEANYVANPKFVYYLSAEYMLGRQLRQNMMYTGTADVARQAVAASGFSGKDLDDLEALDVEPGLGNGGLGRLAACLLDSLATLDMPAVGYGIRYEFGIFKQAFEDGHQVEHPDDWAFYGNPWEFPAPDDRQVVGFYGHTEAVDDVAAGSAPAGYRGRRCAASPATCWSPATAPRRSTSSGYGGPGPAGSRSTWACSTTAATRRPSRRRCARRTSPRCCTPATARRRAGNCGSSSSTSWSPARCGTSSAGSGSATATGRPSPARSPSSSTTPTRSWPSPSSCGCSWTNTESAGSRHGPSPAAPSPTPVTRCCPRPSKPGRFPCSSGCCPATWRSSTPSISSSWTTCAPAFRATTSASRGCRWSRRPPSAGCGWPTWRSSAASRSTAWPSCSRGCWPRRRCGTSRTCGRKSS